MRSFRIAGGLLAIVLLMSSCIRIDGTIKIEDDGSGTVDFLTAVNTDALTGALGDFDVPAGELGGAEELCAGFESEFGDASDFPAGASVTPYDEDGFCGSRVQYPLGTSLDHSAGIQDLFDGSPRLYKEGDNWFFDTDFSVEDITSEAEGAPIAMMQALFEDASFRISLDLPGRAIEGENNATEVGSDGKFTWDIDILNPPARLFAQTEPGSGGGSGGGVSPVLIGVIVAALLGAGALAMFMKQRSDGAASAGAAEPMDPVAHDPFSAGATPQPAAGMPGGMPLNDGPPITATPTPAASPIVPDANAVKETIVMNVADAQQLADPAAAAPVPATPQPVYDETIGAWIVDDPTRGRLRHDPATDTWNPL